MEPCFNVALEKQACGRVHRLGQKRNVQIVRIVVEDSVESRMLQMLAKKYGSSGAISVQENSRVDNLKPSAKLKPAEELAVGSTSSDKVTVVEHEYDLLFGLQAGAIHPADTSSPVANADIPAKDVESTVWI